MRLKSHKCTKNAQHLPPFETSLPKNKNCGAGGHRSPCLLHAKQALYHLSYSPTISSRVKRIRDLSLDSICRFRSYDLWVMGPTRFPCAKMLWGCNPPRGFKGASPFLVAVYLIDDCSAHKLQTICLRELPFSSSCPSASSFEAGCILSRNYNYEKYAVYNLYKSGCVEILSDYLYFHTGDSELSR